jgi:hypothetical protein
LRPKSGFIFFSSLLRPVRRTGSVGCLAGKTRLVLMR